MLGDQIHFNILLIKTLINQTFSKIVLDFS